MQRANESASGPHFSFRRCTAGASLKLALSLLKKTASTGPQAWALGAPHTRTSRCIAARSLFYAKAIRPLLLAHFDRTSKSRRTRAASGCMEGISFLKALNLAVTQLAHFSELFLGIRTVIGITFFFSLLLLLLDRVAKQSKDCCHPLI